MAIRPVRIIGANVEVNHDERGHGGLVPLAAFQPGRKRDGTPDYRFTQIACPFPGCGAVSVHPASGGCDPEGVQRLIAHLILANPAIPARTWAAAKATLKRMVDEMDGPERWRLEDARESDE